MSLVLEVTKLAYHFMRSQIGPAKKAAGAKNAVRLAQECAKVLVQVTALHVEDDVEGRVGEGRPIR